MEEPKSDKSDISDYYFGKGDFSYLFDKFEERYLTYDYKAISEIGKTAWDFLKIGRFEGQMMNTIRKECWQDHTDSTFLKSMKEMKYIYEIGWDQYANGLSSRFW